MKWTKEQWQKQFDEMMERLDNKIVDANERKIAEQKKADFHLEEMRFWRKSALEFQLFKDQIAANFDFVMSNPERYFTE